MNAFAAAGIIDRGRISTAERLASAILAAVRVICRAFCVLFFSGIALLQIAFLLPFVGVPRRLRWLHDWCRFACQVLGLTLTTDGRMPNSGLLVCNHLSYLDIVALSALNPCIFVAKCEVRSWPLFGWLARAGGTIFIERKHRAATMQDLAQIRAAIELGLPVVLFPEGTSSDGSTVLPFKSSLLQAAVDSRCAIAAAGIDYELPDGSVPDEICYWRDMTLLPHLLNLLGKRGIESRIRFSPARRHNADRKTLARELRAEVASLR